MTASREHKEKDKKTSYITDEVRGSLRTFDLQSPCGDPGSTAQVVQVRAIYVLQRHHVGKQKRTFRNQQDKTKVSGDVFRCASH